MHFNNFLILLLALGFGLLKWLASEAKKGSNPTGTKPTAAPPPVPRAPIETDEQNIRKFLEALGQPAGSAPPPPVAHRSDIPPRPVAPVRPPSPYPRNIPGRPKQQIIPAKTSRAPAPVFEVQGRPMPVKPLSEIKTSVEVIPTQPAVDAVRNEPSFAALLRSPSGLRNAIILREIFGPPRSLQPRELV